MRYLLVGWVILWASMAVAWEEPARGTATRAALMDAIRPHAEWELGAPVEFVVGQLRRDGALAYAELIAQRPGGVPIFQPDTPVMQRGEAEDFMDVTQIQVLYKKVRDTWVAVHFAFGATDVWFAYAQLCREYEPVISDYCQWVDY